MKFVIKSAKNPVWSNANSSAIDILVDFESLGEIAFTATPNDSEQHGRELFERATAGEFGAVAAYVAPAIVTPPAPTKEQLMAELAALTAKIQALE